MYAARLDLPSLKRASLDSAGFWNRIVLVAVHLEDEPGAVPLGAACIASAIKAAFPQINIRLVEGFMSGENFFSNILKKIESYIFPDNTACAAGFSLYSWNRQVSVEIAEALRSKYPGMFLFCGGPEATANPKRLVKSEGGVFDALVKGDGEKAVVRMMRHSAGISGQSASADEIFEEPVDDISVLPSPWLDGTLPPGSRGTRSGVLWEMARGCPFGCAYCYESKGSKKVRYFSENRLKAELKIFIQAKVPYIFVLDPTFNINKQRTIRILDMIASECTAGKFTPHIHFEVRAEYLTRPQAERFAALGASLQIGLQTAGASAAALSGRTFDPQRFISKIALLNDAGVVFGLDLIYGLPGDTLSGYKKSLDFAISLYPNTIDMFRLSVLPETVLFDKAEDFGLVFQQNAPYNVISTGDFPAEDLEKAEILSEAADIFYNQGRAVAWFTRILRGCNTNASVFFENFALFLNGRKKSYTFDEIGAVQLDYLKNICEKSEKSGKINLFPAIRDVVRLNGSWSAALAENKTTELMLSFLPDDLWGTAPLAKLRPHPARIMVKPRGGGAEIVKIK
jgi:radical SAM superfamily enzyme YgiQ (UPF0313 family)